MAGDIRKAVLSSLKCSLTGTKIIGNHDVELNISVHIEEERSPSFVDLVKQGIIQFKNFGLQVCEREVQNGCRSCGKGVMCEDRELELVFSVADTSMICQDCSDSNEFQTSPKKRSRRTRKKTTQLTETEQSISNLSSPIVVLERLNEDDVKPFNLDFSLASPRMEVSTPQNTTKYIYGASLPSQFGTPLQPGDSSTLSAGNESSSSSVRRSSRSTKSRYRRNTSPEAESSNVIKPTVYTDVEKTEAVQISPIPTEDKKGDLKHHPDRRKRSSQAAYKEKKQSQLLTSSKKKNDFTDKSHLDLEDSDNEFSINYDEDDNDPDFVVDENAADYFSDRETTVEKESEIATLNEHLIKQEEQDNSTSNVVLEDVTDDTFQIKNEISTASSDNNILSQGVEIIMVSVQNVHEEEYACPVCYKSYSFNRYLQRHVQKAGREPILCDICGAKFHYQKDVEQHMLAHSGINQYMCAVCHKSFPTMSQANKHVKNHLPPHERPYICSTCGKGFTEQHSLQEHSYIHAEIKPYECQKCDAKFAARYLLNSHMKYHGEKRYRCYTCNKVYKLFASLREHLYVYKDHYSNDEPEPIPKVPLIDLPKVSKATSKRKRNKRKSFLEQKEEAKKKLEESLREKSTTPDPSDATNHEQEKSEDDSHANEVRAPNVVDTFQKECLDLIDCIGVEEKPTPADRKKSTIGDEDGIDAGEAGNEENSMKSKTISPKETGEKTERSKPKHGCKICFRKYFQSATLKKHYRKCGKVSYRCGQCEARFHSKEDRAQHKLLHTGKHPYQCKVCFRSFICLSKVKKHAVTHMPPTRRPFACEKCGKGYPSQSELEKHSWIHNKTGPYKCHQCSRFFRTQSAYQRHMNVHRGKVYRCDTCDKEYKYPSSLRDHLKKYNHSCNNMKTKRKTLSPENFEKASSRKKEEEQSVMCDECGITCQNINALRSHKRRHKSEDVPDLENVEELKKFAYQKHVERIESQKARLKSGHGKSGHFPCDECGQEFRLKASLRRHKSMKHGICKHQCHVCQKKFFIPSELERHLLFHFGERKFKCDFCPKAFFHEVGLKRHLKIHVAKEELPHGCDICGKKFIEACYLREHMRRHTGEKPFTCDICGKGFISNNVLKGHKISHGPKKHICSECGKGFAHISNLNAHMRLHKGTMTFNYLCDDCGKSFNSKSGLNRHQIKHTGVRNYRCEQPGCSKAFFFRQELRNHQRAHEDVRPFQCDFCGKSFKYQTSFRNHLQCHKKNPPLKCEICLKEFYLAVRLKRHMEHHLGERNLECDLCDKKFITNSDLAYHKKQHLETFECAFCHKVFKLETRLRSHVKIHEGPERVQCPRCNIFFKDMVYLQTSHLKFCDPKKMCTFCGRKFGSTRKLQSHLGVHSGKRPFQCDECGTAYITASVLLKHQERHKNKRYPCQQCEKGFDRVGDLQIHERLHEKKKHEKKQVEAYKFRLILQEQPGNKTSASLQEMTASTSFEVNSQLNQVFVPISVQSDQQVREDILAQAAAGINVAEDHTVELMEGETLVQYVQEGGDGTQTYSQVLELDTTSLITDQNVPVSAEQVILTTIDASQLSGHGGNEILMVAMIPDTQ